MDTVKRLETLFNPKSVAIIGASKTIGKWGFTFCMHVTQQGYKGEIYPVNPGGGEILGLKVYKNLKEIPGPIDLAIILIPPKLVAGTITELGELNVPVCVVITAGFQEVGVVGQQMEAEIVKAARDADVAMVGPNCAGITSPHPMNLHCMMQPNFSPEGNIALVSQSGNVAGSIMHMMSKLDIGISRSVSVGNQAQLKTEDYLEYLTIDDRTKVVMAYIEGVTDGKRFMEVARELTRVKPLIIIKGGETDSGGQAAKSHTGAIAGSDDVFDGMCRQCGIIRVHDMEDMLDTATAFLSQPVPAGNRVGIAATGGGWGVMLADACVEAGLELAELPEDVLKQLDDLLPPWWNRGNPVDMVAGLSRGAIFKAVEILCKSDGFDSVIMQGFGFNVTNAGVLRTIPDDEEKTVAKYIDAALYSDMRGMNFILDKIEKYGKPILVAAEYSVGADRDRNESILAFRKNNVLVYPSSQRPAKVMARLTRYGKYLREEGVLE